MLLMFNVFVLCVGCVPYRPSLPPLKPPINASEKQRVHWLRGTFYRLYLIEQEAKDGGDRLRRLFLQFPDLSKTTYTHNHKAVENRKQIGKKLRDLERFYLLMNLMIRNSIVIENSTTKPQLQSQLES
jgi:hypothetical protein